MKRQPTKQEIVLQMIYLIRGYYPKNTKNSYNNKIKNNSIEKWVTYLHVLFGKIIDIFFQIRHTNGQLAHEKMFNITVQFSSVQSLSRVRLFATPWIAARQASLSPTPRVHWDSCPSSQWCYPAISSSVVPFSSCPNPSQHQGLFQGVSSSHLAAKVLEFQLQHQSFQWILRTDFL